MIDFQVEKDVVRAHHAAIARANADTIAAALAERTAPDWLWRGMHPFREQRGADAVARGFWSHFCHAMTRLQRRPDIFMGGLNQIDGFRSVWVVSMGLLMGLFDRARLGIRPSGKISMLRYAEFDRVERGRITETAMFFDIP